MKIYHSIFIQSILRWYAWKESITTGGRRKYAGNILVIYITHENKTFRLCVVNWKGIKSIRAINLILKTSLYWLCITYLNRYNLFLWRKVILISYSKPSCIWFLTCFFLLICITRFHAKGNICCCEVHPLPAVLGVKSIGYKSPPTWHERGASTVKNIIQRYTQNSYKNLLKSRSLEMESILEE